MSEVNRSGLRLMLVGAAGVCFCIGFMFNTLITPSHKEPIPQPEKLCPVPAKQEPVACERPPVPKGPWSVGAKVKYINTDGIIPLNSEGTIHEGLGVCRTDEDIIGLSIDFDIAENYLCISAKDLRPN